MITAAKFAPFSLAETLSDGDRVAAYLKVVLEERDSAELLKALHEIADASGLAEFAGRLNWSGRDLAAALKAESIDPKLMLEVVGAVGWRLAPVAPEQAEAA